MKKCNNKQTAVNPAVLEVGKFQIKPAFFEINPGSTVTLEVVFTPQNEESYSEQIVMVCDNCHVKYFTLEGMVLFLPCIQRCLFGFYFIYYIS